MLNDTSLGGTVLIRNSVYSHKKKTPKKTVDPLPRPRVRHIGKVKVTKLELAACYTFALTL